MILLAVVVGEVGVLWHIFLGAGKDYSPTTMCLTTPTSHIITVRWPCVTPCWLCVDCVCDFVDCTCDAVLSVPENRIETLCLKRKCSCQPLEAEVEILCFKHILRKPARKPYHRRLNIREITQLEIYNCHSTYICWLPNAFRTMFWTCFTAHLTRKTSPALSNLQGSIFGRPEQILENSYMYGK